MRCFACCWRHALLAAEMHLRSEKKKQRGDIKDPDDEFRGIAAKDMSKAHHVPDENVWDYLPAVEVRAVLLELFSTNACRATVNPVVSFYEKAPLPFL